MNGCGRPTADVQVPPQPASAAERGYTPPPEIVAAERLADGRVRISGESAPGSRIRLASPQGQPLFATADARGLWRLILPAARGLRLFGLSAPIAGRTVQAQGYIALAPDGECARLRAGSGAVVLARPLYGVGLLAADFDRKGGVVLSGYAPARSSVSVSIDGKAEAVLSADSAGRFTFAPDQPVAPGPHALAVAAGPSQFAASLTVSASPPLASGPYRAARSPEGWRIDWLTPGGGVQTTVLLRSGNSA